MKVPVKFRKELTFVPEKMYIEFGTTDRIRQTNKPYYGTKYNAVLLQEKCPESNFVFPNVFTQPGEKQVILIAKKVNWTCFLLRLWIWYAYWPPWGFCVRGIWRNDRFLIWFKKPYTSHSWIFAQINKISVIHLNYSVIMVITEKNITKGFQL